MNPYKSLKIIGFESSLSKIELRLLLILLGECSINGTARISISELSVMLNTAKSNVSKALSGLVKNNIVIRSDKNNRGKGAGDYILHFNFDYTRYPFAHDYDQDNDTIAKLERDNQILRNRVKELEREAKSKPQPPKSMLAKIFGN